MAVEHDLIRGIRLTDKPSGLSKCGLSRATFANLCKSDQWYKLTAHGKVIGQPTAFDFYRQRDPHKVVIAATTTENQQV